MHSRQSAIFPGTSYRQRGSVLPESELLHHGYATLKGGQQLLFAGQPVCQLPWHQLLDKCRGLCHVLHAELHEGKALYQLQGTYKVCARCCMVWLASPPRRLTRLSMMSDCVTCSTGTCQHVRH